MLFSECEENDESHAGDECCEYPPLSKRLPISQDGSLTAALCDTINVESSTIVQSFASVYRNKRPVIFKNGSSSWESTKLWGKEGNFETLFQHAQSRLEDVEVLVAKDDRNFLKNELCDVIKMPLIDAWQQILFHNTSALSSSPTSHSTPTKMYCRIYLDQHPELLPYFDLKLLRDCASFGQKSTDGESIEVQLKNKNIGLWISTKSCITPLHFDICHGFLSQICGNKTFILSPPEDATPCFYWRDKSAGNSELNAGKNATTCPVDLSLWLSGDETQRKQYPRVNDAAFFIAPLEPGDILYTPPGWLHTVTSETNSISLLVPFDPTVTEKMPQCIENL